MVGDQDASPPGRSRPHVPLRRFSYGDYSAAAPWRASRRSCATDRSREQGHTGPGICNGFQILCETKFARRLMRNASPNPLRATRTATVEGANTMFTAGYKPGRDNIRRPRRFFGTTSLTRHASTGLKAKACRSHVEGSN
jgi:hypothetical protein